VRRFLYGLWGLLVSLLAVALPAVTATTIYVAVTDETDVTALARATACGDAAGASACPWVENEYRVFTRTFEFRTPAQESVRVRCARPQIVLGAYACEVRERRPAPGGGGNDKRAGKRPRAPASATVPAVDGGAERESGPK
jgi:hypothetical protein